MESYLHQSRRLIIFCLQYLLQNCRIQCVSSITLILVECKPKISINHTLCELQSLFSIFYVLPPPFQFLIISFSLQRSLLISYHLTVGGLTSPIPIKSLFETRKHSDCWISSLAGSSGKLCLHLGLKGLILFGYALR